MNNIWNTSLALSALLWAGSAVARTLMVGPDQHFKAPSEAIAAARNGDTVRIETGQYFDCAVVPQNNLTIEGTGPNVVLTDKVCEGKALLVIAGSNVTVRNITLQRARVPDQNGAGIRAEGGNLVVENSRFLNNEDGILTADNPQAAIRIIDSEFTGNGKCGSACAHGIYVGKVGLLRIERSRFLNTHQGHHIKSRAVRTEIINSDIKDGPEGTSSYLIDIPNGGTVIVDGNRMEKGPRSENQGTAIMIGEEGVDRPTDELLFKNNNFTNDQSRPTVFVNNNTATPAQLVGNVLRGPVRSLEGDGSVH
jgi:hypothetical protein